MVDDPIDCPDEFPNEADQTVERERLHELLSNISRWENTDERKPENATLMDEARYEIARSIARSRGGNAPSDPDEVLKYLSDAQTGLTIYDPFSGGGSIPLEAQRLGLNAIGSDLNPIAVLITKAMIELPTQFKDSKPVNPGLPPTLPRRAEHRSNTERTWQGYAGLAHDIRYYGERMKNEAFKKIGHNYPTVPLDDGSEATVVAWLWANTVPCPNPACPIEMPLIRNFQVSKQKGRPRWTQPSKSNTSNAVEFNIVDNPSGIKVRLDEKDPNPKTVGKSGAICFLCETARPLDYVRDQALAGKMNQQLIGVVAEGKRRKVFVAPNEYHAEVALRPKPSRRPEGTISPKALGIRNRGYGLTKWNQLFTERQLTSLCTFSDVLTELRSHIIDDGARPEYADVLQTYLALAIGRLAHAGSKLCMWVNSGDFVAGVFGRQTVNMVWDFAESNPFSSKTQNWMAQIEWVAKVVERLPPRTSHGSAFQADAANSEYVADGPVIVTDPPYYDNIGYADISDFFYIWHKDMLRQVYPDLFIDMQTPKHDEIIAGPMFDNSKERFENLLSEVLIRIRGSSSQEFPSSIFYAYKQKDAKTDGMQSTGWETFLTAVNNAGMRIVGTWPVHTERGGRLRARNSNTLASSVVLVTRPRSDDAPVANRQQFIAELDSTLPTELDRLTRQDNIAPVDLAQAAIGPGMEIYTKYSRVETISGEPVSVREALTEINRVIGDYFLGEQGELDEDTRFCLDWLRSHDFGEGPFGDAENIAKSKNITTGALQAHGILTAHSGKAQLAPADDYGPESNRKSVNPNTSSWEGLMRCAWHFGEGDDRGGVAGAADVIREMGSKSEEVERLARIMFDYYDRKFQPSNSRVYNDIADAWRDIREQAGYGRQLTNV